MAVNDLVLVADVERHLDIPTGSGDAAQLGLQIEVASQIIEDYLDRKIKSQAVIEIFDGRRDNRLILKQWPVTAITDVRFDSASDFSDPTTIVDSSTYRLVNAQEIVNLYGSWPIGYQNIKVSYTAGYNPIPASIRNACLQLIEYLEDRRIQRDIGNTSKSKGGESVSLVESIPKFIVDQLEPYKRIQFPLGEIPNMNW
jgi:hypothetical protein